MNDQWDPSAARKKLKATPETLVCDALLDQSIFSGVGNISKNEELFRIKLHPERIIGKLDGRKPIRLIVEIHVSSLDFLRWRKVFELKKHWLAYSKKNCPRCEVPLGNKWLGQTHRKSFFCKNCQTLYK